MPSNDQSPQRFYNDTDHRQCAAVDEQGLDCAAAEGHEPRHANVNGEWDDEPEPFNPITDCHPNRDYGGGGPCGFTERCTLRCHIRYLDGQDQANDWLVEQRNAEAWRRYYAANPGAEEASRAACDPKTYERKQP